MKYLLDTNVISELAEGRVRVGLIHKFDENRHDVCISSVTLHELRYGVAKLMPSKRTQALKAFLEDVVLVLPILNYDARAADWHAYERARLANKGLTPPFVDGQIAAIAHVNNLTLVTSDRRDFASFAGLEMDAW